MSFFATTLGSPTLCIRGGVNYEKQYLSPDSGNFNFSSPSLNNWSFINSLKYQNSRINGRYVLENYFDQGYFNFENWSGQVTYSTDGTKSGYQSVLNGGSPGTANFWGIGDTQLSRDCLYNYGSVGTKPKNISTCALMSGVNTGVSGTYPNMEVYIGSIPSGEMTIYGRVGSINSNYTFNDNILSFNVPTTMTGTGGGSPASTSYAFPGTASVDTSIGSFTWANPDNIKAEDGSYSESSMSGTDEISNYILGTNFGFFIPGTTITSITATIKWDYVGYGGSDYSVRLFYIGTPIGVDKGNDVLGAGTLTNEIYTWSTGEFGSLTGDKVSDFRFGVAFASKQHGGVGNTFPRVDSIKVQVNYLTAAPMFSTGLVGSFGLINNFGGANRRLNWVSVGFGDPTIIDMPINRVTSNSFSHFLLTYTQSTGLGKFYTATDETPFILENVAFLGDISQAFTGKTKFFEDSYSTAGGTVICNPKLISDYGIANKAWSDSDISLFDQHRLNSAYFINEDPLTIFASPSGSDTTSLNFHFPVHSSGKLGACDSGNYQAINYYTPLSSGLNDRLYEFEKTQFKNSALTLDLWVENNSTNPSGNLGCRIDFNDSSAYFGRTLYTMTNFWSGYPVQVGSGIHQVRMSGLVFNSSNDPSDLFEVTKTRGNQAGLYTGAWFENIGKEYNGDIRVYSAKVSLDGYVIPAMASGQVNVYMSGRQAVSDSFPLYLQNSHIDNNFPIYLNGNVTVNDGFPLYISGGFAQNSFPIYLNGKTNQSGSFPCFIAGSTAKASMPLYTFSAAPPSVSSHFPISMWATTNSGYRDHFPLFVGDNAPSGKMSGSMNLSISGPSSAKVYAGMNMFLRSDAPKQTDGFSLYLANNYQQVNDTFPLFLQSPSGTDGAIPVNGSMNLFLARDSESVAHNFPIFLSAPDSTNNQIPMYISGANIVNDQVPLTINGIGKQTGTLPTYINGF